MAETKLFVMLTSKLNRTPPMGEPNATDIPAAAAADRTSRFRAIYISDHAEYCAIGTYTFIAVDVRKEFHEKICATACDMHERTFLAKPHSRCNRKALNSQYSWILHPLEKVLPIPMT